MEHLWCGGRKSADKHDTGAADLSDRDVATWSVDERPPASSSSQAGNNTYICVSVIFIS